MKSQATLARALAAQCATLEAAGLAPEQAERQVFEALLGEPDAVWPELYEAFVAAYAPARRRQHGVYYTPAEVVACQVDMVADLLRRLDATFEDARVLVVDPATGSGAYPKAIVQRGATPRFLLCEPLPGAALLARASGLDVLECDALEVNCLPQASIVVCLGNPPYRRRRGDRRFLGRRPKTLQASESAGPLDGGIHAKNLHNDYVYFWLWALRQVFERRPGPGVVSFVTASSYLRGPAFPGLREAMRRHLDELWIVDLEGDGLAARRSANVFAIRTPIAIATGVRYGNARPDRAAVVHYRRLSGDRLMKLEALSTVRLASADWHPVGGGWSGPLVASRSSAYDGWPRLTELFPWQISGVQMKRTWPIAPTPELLRERWARLLAEPTSADREAAFGATRDRSVQSKPIDLLAESSRLAPIAELPAETPAIQPVPYAYRSFDRHWLLPDARLGDFMRPSLWRMAGPRQVFLTSLLTNVLGSGPAAVATALVPDLDCFRGSFGARAVIPLWREMDASRPNVAEGVLDCLSECYGRAVTPPDLLAYCYALLGTRGYVARFEDELRTPGPRIPLPIDSALFWRAAGLGQQLLDVHTYRQVAIGSAQEVAPIGDGLPASFDYEAGRLDVGSGSIRPVTQPMWDYAVSGLPILRSWLRRRIAPRRGRSPLDAVTLIAWSDNLTRELLELLWLLEATLRLEPALDAVLDDIVSSSSRSGVAWTPSIGDSPTSDAKQDELARLRGPEVEGARVVVDALAGELPR